MVEFNTYIQKEDHTELIVHSDTYGDITFLISNEDVDLVKQYKWHVEFNKKLLSKFYLATKIGYGRKGTKNLRLHRLLTSCPKDLVVDHINRDTLDNRRENLRCVTRAENNRNKEIINTHNTTTGIKGITYYFYKGWNDYSYLVNIKGCKNNRFRTLEDAIAYKEECLLGKHQKESLNDSTY